MQAFPLPALWKGQADEWLAGRIEAQREWRGEEINSAHDDQDEENFSDANVEDALASLHAATNVMDEAEVTMGGRILFITPTLKGVLDDFSLANPARSNRVLDRFSRMFATVSDTLPKERGAPPGGCTDGVGYRRAGYGCPHPDQRYRAQFA